MRKMNPRPRLVQCPSCYSAFYVLTSNKTTITMRCPICRKKGAMYIKK